MKKILVIVAFIIIILVVIFTIDYIRVIHYNLKPLAIIYKKSKKSSSNYYGIGYSFIYYDKNNNNKYIKAYIFGIKIKTVYIIENIENDKYVLYDPIKEENIACAEALKLFYEDDEYNYYYPCIKTVYLKYLYKKINIKVALKENIVTIEELEELGLEFIKQKKNV